MGKDVSIQKAVAAKAEDSARMAQSVRSGAEMMTSLAKASASKHKVNTKK